MLLKLTLENFRSFEKRSFDLDSNSIVFTGRNGSGKTSVLEAVHFFSTLRSFRTSRLRELNRLGSPGFHVSLELSRPGGWKKTLEISDTDGRRLCDDGNNVSKASSFLDYFTSFTFLPDDSEIIYGGPLLRRRFVDMFICTVDKKYFTSLQRYGAAVKNYNAVLRGGENADRRTALSYGEVMAAEAGYIIEKRIEILKDLGSHTAEILEKLRPECRKFSIRSAHDPKITDQSAFMDRLASSFDREKMRGVTSTGPHLDEMEITLDGRLLRNYGSRGQCRMAVLSMKMAALETMRGEFGKDPVILVDDALADLDRNAKDAFLETISPAEQIFYAFTELPSDTMFAKSTVITL